MKDSLEKVVSDSEYYETLLNLVKKAGERFLFDQIRTNETETWMNAVSRWLDKDKGACAVEKSLLVELEKNFEKYKEVSDGSLDVYLSLKYRLQQFEKQGKEATLEMER